MYEVAWPGKDDIALDLARFDAVVDRLLARPPLGVQACVDDEAARAKELLVHLAEQPFGIVRIPARFCRETLGISAHPSVIAEMPPNSRACLNFGSD